MNLDFKIKAFVMKSGERYCLLVNANSGLLRILEHREHPLWSNVNTNSGLS